MRSLYFFGGSFPSNLVWFTVAFVAAMIVLITGPFSRSVVLADPSPISTCQELEAMNINPSGSYVLTGNIDCSSSAALNNGLGFEPIGSTATPFNGNLDGDGFTISGLTINQPTLTDQGLFGVVSGATINNLSLSGQSLTAAGTSGLLAGSVTGTTQSVFGNDHVNGSVNDSASDVGGLIGNANRVSVSNSTAAVTFTNANGDYLGGLIGSGTYVSLLDDNSSGTIVASSSNTSSGDIGGIVGILSESTLDSDSSSVAVAGNLASGIGGLVGVSDGTSTLSLDYATGSVAGRGFIGGFIGSDSGDMINQAYASGAVTIEGTNAQDSAGFIGSVTNGVIKNAYASGSVSTTDMTNSASNSSGFIGLIGGNAQVFTSYNSGNVTSNGNYVGGFYGSATSLTQTYNVFSSGKVTAPNATNVGGFTGYFNEGQTTGTISNSYYDAKNSGQIVCGAVDLCVPGGVVGVNQNGSDPEYFQNSASVAPYFIAASQNNWDFNSIWETTPGYPELRFHPTFVVPAPVSRTTASSSINPEVGKAVQVIGSSGQEYYQSATATSGEAISPIINALIPSTPARHKTTTLKNKPLPKQIQTMLSSHEKLIGLSLFGLALLIVIAISFRKNNPDV